MLVVWVFLICPSAIELTSGCIFLCLLGVGNCIGIENVQQSGGSHVCLCHCSTPVHSQSRSADIFVNKVFAVWLIKIRVLWYMTLCSNSSKELGASMFRIVAENGGS